MEPLKPAHKYAILRDRRAAAPEDIVEYERLLARRFAHDPSLPMSPMRAATKETDEARLRALHAKLYLP